MEVLYDRVAGLDVGKASLTVCVRTPGARRGRRSETRTFKTTTPSIYNLWLHARWRRGSRSCERRIRLLQGLATATEPLATPHKLAERRLLGQAAKSHDARLIRPGGLVNAEVRLHVLPRGVSVIHQFVDVSLRAFPSQVRQSV
jgi:hypothetical protein